MDLNYLYHRHGVSLAMAARARCDQSRHVHQQLASAYAEQISGLIRTRSPAGMRPALSATEF